MGSSKSKEEGPPPPIEESSSPGVSFHIVEIHYATAGYSLLSVIAILLLIYGVTRCTKRWTAKWTRRPRFATHTTPVPKIPGYPWTTPAYAHYHHPGYDLPFHAPPSRISFIDERQPTTYTRRIKEVDNGRSAATGPAQRNSTSVTSATMTDMAHPLKDGHHWTDHDE